MTMISTIMSHTLAQLTTTHSGIVLHRDLHCFRVACSCALDRANNLTAIQMEYWRLLDEWINVNGTYDPYDDFTVVLQTQLRDMEPVYTVHFYTVHYPDINPIKTMIIVQTES